MDSLTARIMSRSGLNPVDPTLPPVHNMRMVYLKEPFGDAEEALHDARVALENLENGTGRAKDLYMAMIELELKEQDYFATRYFGRNKTVLKGWKGRGKRFQFRRTVENLGKVTRKRFNDMGGAFGPTPPGYSIEARRAAIAAYNAYEQLDFMIKCWYDHGWVKRLAPRNFRNSVQNLETSVENIEYNRQIVFGRPQSDLTKNADLRVIETSRKETDTYKRLALLLKDDKWVVPYDLMR